MFRWVEAPWKERGVALEVCCKEFICHLARCQFQILGITMECPDIVDGISDANIYGQKLMFCPMCGERLKPEEKED